MVRFQTLLLKGRAAALLLPYPLGLLFSSVLFATSPGLAQLIPDDTAGTQIQPDVEVQGLPSDLIEGGTVRDHNLFHSFEAFNVEADRGVYFTTQTGILNILTRVTGNDVSNIDGTLGVLGNADLFLINPNGIVFGPDATLNLNGSFLGSTASSLTFTDGSEFTAMPTANELLTISVPLGLQLSNQPQGDIISAGRLRVGQDLTLIGRDLTLMGQLLAGHTLTLQSQETVTLRDTATEAFVIGAGSTLTIQGAQLVDIFALNHPESGLFSGGELILRSNNPVIGDGHFFAGGNLRIETLDSQIGNLLSPNDPIILARGNVELGDYTGASLHILAGGSVTLGETRVISPGGDTSSLHSDNDLLFNDSLTYADLATFEVSDYEVVTNIDGTLSQVPIQRTITVDGNDEATLDVRAGVDWEALGGLPSAPVVVGPVAPTLPGGELSSEITITGPIRIFEPDGGGQLVLTNRYQPNTALAAGPITIGSVNASAFNIANADGGRILLYSQGDVMVDGGLSSLSFANSGDAGAGGNIAISAVSGAVTLGGSVNTFSESSSANASSGGAISISASGDINTNELFSYSIAPGLGDAAAGGDISLFSTSGNITIGPSDKPFLGRVQSFSESAVGQASSGGDVRLFAPAGTLMTNGPFNSASRSDAGTAGTGGNISLSALSDVTTNGALSSFSASNTGTAGTGGNISLFSESGNLFVNRILLASSDSIAGSAAGLIHCSRRKIIST
ncbi:MAG: filamentous hemagglutinin N-terminal domain-containing protein [Leptolyngbyaceae cyanobacterium]